MGADIAAGAHCALVWYRAGEGKAQFLGGGFPSGPKPGFRPFRFRRRPCGPRRSLWVRSKQASIGPRKLTAASRRQSPLGSFRGLAAVSGSPAPLPALRPWASPFGSLSKPCGLDRVPGPGSVLRLHPIRFGRLARALRPGAGYPSEKVCGALLPSRPFRRCGSSPEGFGSAETKPESGVGLRGTTASRFFQSPSTMMFGYFSLAGSVASCHGRSRFYRPFPSGRSWPEIRD
jgi:hypothetical protein